MVTKQEIKALESVSDDAAPLVQLSEPYIVKVKIEGACPILWHRWDGEAVELKTGATKGSKAKKTDNVESYVWRDKEKNLCLPGDYLRQSIVWAAKFRQDPRSPRKSAMDLFKASIIPLTELAPVMRDGKTIGKEWDYIDQRRAVVQRNAVNRRRPANDTGWQAEILLMCNLPEYIDPQMLLEVTGAAGRLVGVADYRPVYGRFNVIGWEVADGENSFDSFG